MFASEVYNDATLFREIFYSALGSTVSPQEFQQLFLLPTKELFPDPKLADLANYETRVRSSSPDKLYEYTKAQPIPSQHFDIMDVLRKSEPITIVFMPGFYEEMCLRPAFGEVVGDSTSTAAVRFRKALSGANLAAVTARRYDVRHLAEIDVGLDEVIKVGSIDDADGHPRITIVYLNPVMGSLETIGSLHSTYQRYLERLDRYFALMGRSPRLYLGGHSMGANRALDFLATMNSTPKKPDWFKNVRGLVTVNGALFGSDYAEAVFKPETRPGRMHKNLKRVLDLKEDDGILDAIANKLAWISIISRISYEFAFTSTMNNEDIPYSTPISLSQTSRFWLSLKEMLNVHRGEVGYIDMIRRFKTCVRAVFAAIEDLRPQTRRAWWSSAFLPPNLFYINISGTMASPNSQPSSPLATSPGMGLNTIEYRVFRDFYLDTYAEQSISLNDGLVGLHQSVMQSAWHTKLNPAQRPYEVHWLGIMGAHHAGTVFETFMADDPMRFNNFPRTALVKSIAVFANLMEPLTVK